jgi:hypothetical protein
MIVARDPEGRSVYDSSDYWVKVGPERVETRPVGASTCEPKLRIRFKADGESVTARVIAWPAAKGVTPRQVAGSVRLSAWPSGGGVKTLGTRVLQPAATTGVARFRFTLPAGSWRLEARYISSVGISYPQALDRQRIIITPGQPAGGGTSAPSRATPEPST